MAHIEKSLNFEKEEVPELATRMEKLKGKLAELEEHVKSLPYNPASEKKETEDAAENSWESKDESSWGQSAAPEAAEQTNYSSSWDRGGDSWY